MLPAADLWKFWVPEQDGSNSSPPAQGQTPELPPRAACHAKGLLFQMEFRMVFRARLPTGLSQSCKRSRAINTSYSFSAKAAGTLHLLAQPGLLHTSNNLSDRQPRHPSLKGTAPP